MSILLSALCRHEVERARPWKVYSPLVTWMFNSRRIARVPGPLSYTYAVPPSGTILETERMLMRRLVPDDIDALFALYSDLEIRRYFPEGTLSFSQTQEELEWFLNGHPEHPELGLWATIHKETREFIGRCGLLPWTIDGHLEIEIAYMIDKHYWRQGLGREAAQALVGHGFDHLRLRRLIALIDPEHESSIRTAMSAGLTFDRTIEMDGVMSVVYSITNPTRR